MAGGVAASPVPGELDRTAANANATPAAGPQNEFNITNFTVDANSDWLFKQEGDKYMASA
jgi:hypothetical protein